MIRNLQTLKPKPQTTNPQTLNIKALHPPQTQNPKTPTLKGGYIASLQRRSAAKGAAESIAWVALLYHGDGRECEPWSGGGRVLPACVNNPGHAPPRPPREAREIPRRRSAPPRRGDGAGTFQPETINPKS